MKKQNKKTEEKIVDAQGRTLGRVASEVATLLMGKNSVLFQRNIMSGSPVKVINASKIKITAKKLEEITHLKYSGYPGGLRITKGTETIEKKGYKELLGFAIYRMLPGNKLRRDMLKNLTVID